MIKFAAALFLSLMAVGAIAKAPDVSLRPVARPGSVATVATPDIQMALKAALRIVRPKMSPKHGEKRAKTTRPASRPERSELPNQTSIPKVEKPEIIQTAARQGLLKSLRPLLRPRKIRRQAVAARKLAAKGAVCGDVAIQGVKIGAVPGKINGCGVQSAVKVRSINGISLSQNATMDCVTAKALKSWVNKGLKPAVGNRGGGVKQIKVVAHYACRTRNSQKGAKISEHGKGRAIDIAAFTLRDGTEISVLKDWDSGSKGKVLRRMHSAACGPFGTVLGPEANHFHRDHFHFDTARYRSGSYCR